MKARPVTANIIQLTRFHFVNAFLVREEDGFTLVDTTMGNAAEALIRAASQGEGAIRRIALTHGHGDHVGALDALKQELGASVEILMPELDTRIHAGEQVVEGKLPGSWPKLTTRPDVLLSGGERIGSLEAIPLPATAQATSRISTPATALLLPETSTRHTAPRPSRTTAICGFRSRPWRHGTRARTSTPPVPSGSSSRRPSPSGMDRRSAIRGPRWMRQSCVRGRLRPSGRRRVDYGTRTISPTEGTLDQRLSSPPSLRSALPPMRPRRPGGRLDL